MVVEEHKGSLKAEVWNHFFFDKATDQVKCKHCGKVLKARGSSRSGLARDFETFHRSAQDTNQVVKKQKIDIPSYFSTSFPIAANGNLIAELFFENFSNLLCRCACSMSRAWDL